MDVEAHERGETLYAPDQNVRLYPPDPLRGRCEPAARRDAPRGRLDDGRRRDRGGQSTSTSGTALVRSRAKLDYVSAQQALDGGTAEEQLRLLREVGILRLQREERRGGVSLPIPEQVITEKDDEYGLQLPRAAPRRGVERPDLADDGNGRRGAHARAAASASSAPCRSPTPTASRASG